MLATTEGPLFLGVEGGATRTVAILSDAEERLVQRIEAGPANLKLLTDAQLQRQLSVLAKRLPRPAAVCLGLAGLRTDKDRARVLGAAAAVWPDVPCEACADLETALAAAPPSTADGARTRVLVLSGTGSCCFGRRADGHPLRVGGWGHLLGDDGSGYAIAIESLRRSIARLDHTGTWPRLGQDILRTLQFNEPDDLIDWVQAAEKKDIAKLAVTSFEAWERRDEIASEILDEAAGSLAGNAAACARRIARLGDRVEFILAGSVLLKQPAFCTLLARKLKELWPDGVLIPMDRESAWGAVRIARSGWLRRQHKHGTPSALQPPGRRSKASAAEAMPPADSRADGQVFIPASTALSPTERRNPRSERLDTLPISDAIEVMLSEEGKVPKVLLRQREQIERCIRFVVRTFRRGGRLFYVGAGTSGRIGALDASECPPTFRAPPDQVQGIMAGGREALWNSLEGAEDDAVAGADAIRFRGVNRKDLVAGIAASGRTPFVWGALHEARRRGAATILICFNPYLEIPRKQKPDIVLASDLGPEVLTGSTRLKAGTATKLLLNLFTTLAMVQMGKTASNLMVDLNPSNQKLRLRAMRIVSELTGASEEDAAQALERSSWVIKKALTRLARKRGGAVSRSQPTA